MRFSSKRLTELFVDVSSSRSIHSLSDYLKKDLDIIIDDASHNLKDILTAFGILFKKLKSGGCYVIEDMDQFKPLKELNPYSGEATPLEILNKINDKQDFKTSFINDESKKGNYFVKKPNLMPLKFYIEFLRDIIGFKPIYSAKQYNNIIYNPVSCMQEVELDKILLFDNLYVKKLLKR